MIILALISTLPCFSTVVESPSPQTFFEAVEIPSGYLVLGEMHPSWGGQGQLWIHMLDTEGEPASSGASTVNGIPAASESVFDGILALCSSPDSMNSTLVFIDETGTEQWTTLLSGDFRTSAAIHSFESGILVAGNSSHSPTQPVLALLDPGGGIIWQDSVAGIDAEVRDLSLQNDTILLLCSTMQPGWQTDICFILYDLNEGLAGEVHLQPEQGRFSPRRIVAAPEGIFILADAMTEESGMIYQTLLIKLDDDFSVQWTGILSGSSWMRGTDMLQLADGDLTICGWTNALPPSEINRSDLMLCHFNQNGIIQWYRTYGEFSPDYGLGISQTLDGGFVISGCVTEDHYQGWVLRTDSLGLLEPQGIEYSESSHACAGLLGNPSTDGVIRFSVLLEEGSSVELMVFDTSGRLLETAQTYRPAGESIVSTSESLPSGMYITVLRFAGGSHTFKAMICGEVR